MINILAHGYKTYKTTCIRCNCTFTYDIEDMEDTKIKCPDCNCTLDHYPSEFVRNSNFGEPLFDD